MSKIEIKKYEDNGSLRHLVGGEECIPGARLRTDRNSLPSARYYDAPERPAVASFYHAPKTVLRFPQEPAAQREAQKKRKRRWLLPLLIVLMFGTLGGFLMMQGNAPFFQWPDFMPAASSNAPTATPVVAPTPTAAPSGLPTVSPAQMAALLAVSPKPQSTPATGSEATATPAPSARILVTPQATRAATTPTVYDTLRTGDQGDAVTRMQQALIELGYLKEDQSDGSYGDITRQAVRAFQRSNQLEVDGVAGSQTQQLLYGGDALPNPEE